MRRTVVVLALLAGTRLAAQEAPAGGTADGWLEVARERTSLRFARVLGEAGDGASGDLRVLISDRPLPDGAVNDAGVLDDLAAEDAARTLAARLPEGGGEIEVAFHHPRLPRGISLVGLARFVPESTTPDRLEGRLVLDDPGTAFEVWFSAPIERRERPAGAATLPTRQPMSLDEAIRSGDPHELAAALAGSPSLDAAGGSGMSPLAMAADAGNPEAVRQLLAAGAAVDWRADRASLSPLMIASGRSDPAVVEALLAAGANPKLRTSSGFTALHHAVLEGRIENVRRLVAAGADVARDREGLLRIAGEKGHAEIAALLAAAPAPTAP